MTDAFVEIIERKIIHRQKTTNRRLNSFFSVNLLSVMIFAVLTTSCFHKVLVFEWESIYKVNVSKIDDDGWETKYWLCLHYINIGGGMNPCGD